MVTGYIIRVADDDLFALESRIQRGESMQLSSHLGQVSEVPYLRVLSAYCYDPYDEFNPSVFAVCVHMVPSAECLARGSCGLVPCCVCIVILCSLGFPCLLGTA